MLIVEISFLSGFFIFFTWWMDPDDWSTMLEWDEEVFCRFLRQITFQRSTRD
jgi:hypothetical protein